MPAFRNPLPHLTEAADSVAKIALLQRDLFFLKSELKAMRQIKTAVVFLLGLITLNLSLVLGAFWLTQSLHEMGWTSPSLALLGFLSFGSISAICTVIGLRMTS